MNGLDIAIVAVIALSALFAFVRGFVREALSIAAWVGAALIALYGFPYLYGIVVRFVTTPLLAELITGAGLFLVSLVVLTILTGYVARFVQSSALSPIDRTLGLIFGLARGVLLVALAYLVVDIALPQNDRPDWIREAKSERFLAKGADMLRSALPESLQVKSAAAADDAHRAVEQAQEAQKAMRLAPAAQTRQPDAPVYKREEQRNLDRLFQSETAR